MELNETLKDKIAGIFREVEYGRITFFISPDKQKMGYTVEHSRTIDNGRQKNSKLERDEHTTVKP